MELRIVSKNKKIDFLIQFCTRGLLELGILKITPIEHLSSLKEVLYSSMFPTDSHFSDNDDSINMAVPYDVYQAYSKLGFQLIPDEEFKKGLDQQLLIHQTVDENLYVEGSTVFLKESHFRSAPKNFSINLSQMYKVVEDGIRIVPNENSARLEVLKVNWLGCHERTYIWTLAKEVPLDSDFKSEIRQLLNSKHFGYCKTCNHYTLRGHMFERYLCDGCATNHCGVMF